jgi:hypothetical protein
VLITELPLESRTARKLGAHKPGDPTSSDLLELDLLALAVETASSGNVLFFAANTKKGTTLPEPIRIPRVWREVGEDEGPKEQSTPEELRSFLGPKTVIRYQPKTEEANP